MRWKRGDDFGPYRLLEPLASNAQLVTFAVESLARTSAAHGALALSIYRERPPAALIEHHQRATWSRALVAGPWVRIHEVLEESGTHALAIDHIRGRALSEVQDERAGRAFETKVALRLLLSAAHAVELFQRAAHARGQGAPILHGALGLDTLLVTESGPIALLGLENAGNPGPAIDHQAPEQIILASPDPRSDVFALGSIAHRLLSGVPRIQPGRRADQRRQALEYAFTWPEESIAPLPPPLEATLRAALAPDPRDRFQSPRELAEALISLAEVDPKLDPTSEASLPDYYETGDSLAMWSNPNFAARTISASFGGEPTEILDTLTSDPRSLGWETRVDRRVHSTLPAVSTPVGAKTKPVRLSLPVVIAASSMSFILALVLAAELPRSAVTEVEPNAVARTPAPIQAPRVESVPRTELLEIQTTPLAVDPAPPILGPEPELRPRARRPKDAPKVAEAPAPETLASERSKTPAAKTPSSEGELRLRALSKRVVVLGMSAETEALLGQIVLEMSAQGDDAARSSRIEALERQVERLERNRSAR